MLKAVLSDEQSASVGWTSLGEEVVRWIEALSPRSGAAQTPSYYDPTKEPQAPEQKPASLTMCMGDIEAIPALAKLPIVALMDGGSDGAAPRSDRLATLVPWPVRIPVLIEHIEAVLP